MKKFSKILCLVLVVVMMAGLCAVGTTAAYKDADKITYTEAVDVLSAIGVLQGDDNGFRPADGLTRAEACKIVAYLMGAENVSAKTSFTDAKGHWAESFIAYCAGQGYVNGVGGNKFNPDGALTGSAFAKMLLCALGYDASIEGMTGDTYEVAVARLVKTTKLAAGISKFVGANAITREQAAQLGLNALTTAEVEYTTSITQNSNGSTSTITNIKATPAGLTLMEDVFPTLTKKSVADDKGETETVWTYGTTKIGTYGANKPIITYTATTKNSVIASDLAGYTWAAGTLYVDGAATTKTLAITDVNGNDGNGTTVQVYANQNKEIVKVVVLHTYLYEVTAKNTVGGTMTLTERTAGADAANTINLTKLPADKNADFYAGIYALNKGDFVMLNILNDASDDQILANLGAPKTETGKYTKAATVAGVTTYTVGGTAYEIGDKAAARAGLAAAADNSNNKVFIDNYGYALYTKAVAGVSNYAYVLNTQIKQDYDAATYEYKLLFPNGTVEWAKATAYQGKFDSTAKGYLAAIAQSNVVTYVKNDDGTYNITSKTASTPANGKSVAKNTVVFDTSKNMTKDSVLLVEQADGTFKVYTGVANMPNLTITTGNYYNDANNNVIMIVANKENTASKDVLYFAKNLAAGDATTVEYVNGAAVYTFKAFLNGSVQDIQVTAAALTAGIGGTPNQITAGLYVGATADASGAYTAMTATSGGNTTAVTGDNTTKTVAGMYSFTGAATDTLKNNGTSLIITDASPAGTISFIVSSDFEGYEVVTADLASYEFGSATTTTTLTGAATIYVHVNADGQADWAIATTDIPDAA